MPSLAWPGCQVTESYWLLHDSSAPPICGEFSAKEHPHGRSTSTRPPRSANASSLAWLSFLWRPNWRASDTLLRMTMSNFARPSSAAAACG